MGFSTRSGFLVSCGCLWICWPTVTKTGSFGTSISLYFIAILIIKNPVAMIFIALYKKLAQFFAFVYRDSASLAHANSGHYCYIQMIHVLWTVNLTGVFSGRVEIAWDGDILMVSGWMYAPASVCTLTDTGLISTALYIVQPDSSRTTSVLRLQRLTVVSARKMTDSSWNKN